MVKVQRYPHNPLLTPDEEKSWESSAVFNACPVKVKNQIHLLYRAMSRPQHYYDQDLELSSIGHALSRDGLHFKKREPFINPEYKWEQFGCEDPRVTKLEDKYYIFYTALSHYPPAPDDIKIGVAITSDFREIEKKLPVTHFNSKAMALFPEKINGQYVAILTADTDRPPAKIALAFLRNIDQLWAQQYWENWLPSFQKSTLPLQRTPFDHIELGAPPLKTKTGWLIIYCYIKDYHAPPATFGIEAALLDLENPLKVIGRTKTPLLVPKEEYELYGKVNNVIFPSGALISGDQLLIYYGAADTTVCLAQLKLAQLLQTMLPAKKSHPTPSKTKRIRLERFSGNPLIIPQAKHHWESEHTFNAAATLQAGKVHLLYRAMDKKETSVLGYASLADGLHIDERLNEPVYLPREIFEKKVKPGYSGCEDPRLTRIGSRLFMCYTAFDGRGPTRIALTSIDVQDFLNKHWNWARPIIISFPGRDDKNACLLSEKIKDQYIFFHRIGGCIWIDSAHDFNFGLNNWLGGKIILCPRLKHWDSQKIGIAGPPHKTQDGWLLIYHGLSESDLQYRLGALLLDLKNPEEIIARLDYPLIEPKEDYEKQGLRPGTIFSCGSVIIKDRLYVYYGAADHVVAVATTKLTPLLKALKESPFSP